MGDVGVPLGAAEHQRGAPLGVGVAHVLGVMQQGGNQRLVPAQARPQQRRPPVLRILVVGIGPVPHQRPHGGIVPELGGEREGAVALALDVRAAEALEQLLEHRRVAKLGGGGERGQSILVHAIVAGARADKTRDDAEVAVACGEDERGAPHVGALGVDVGSMVE